jgi:hypothetical protein
LAEAEADLREVMERRRSAPLGDRVLLDGLDRSIELKRQRLTKLRLIAATLARARLRTAVE